MTKQQIKLNIVNDDGEPQTLTFNGHVIGDTGKIFLNTDENIIVWHDPETGAYIEQENQMTDSEIVRLMSTAMGITKFEDMLLNIPDEYDLDEKYKHLEDIIRAFMQTFDQVSADLMKLGYPRAYAFREAAIQTCTAMLCGMSTMGKIQ